jgi:hypothetical protein
MAGIAALLVVPGCSGSVEGPSVEPETYIEVMVALRRAHNETSSTAEFEQRREQILRDASVTDSMLVQWARARGLDAGFMAQLWDSINTRLAADPDRDSDSGSRQ